MNLGPVTSFYDYVFGRIGEPGSFLINNGVTFNSVAVTLIALLPHTQIPGIGTIDETSFRILIRGSDLVLPPKMSDRVLFRGLQYSISEKDIVTLSINGIVVAYQFQVVN